MNKLDYFRNRGKLIHLDLDEDEIWKRMVRTGLQTICPGCGKTHIEHPYIDNVLDETTGDPTPFLHYICDGMIVKL